MINLKKKDVEESFKVYKVGYCELEQELNVFGTHFYNSGSCGWNCDIYIFDNFVITTGYRPFGERLSEDAIDYIKNSYKALSTYYNNRSVSNWTYDEFKTYLKEKIMSALRLN